MADKLLENLAKMIYSVEKVRYYLKKYDKFVKLLKIPTFDFSSSDIICWTFLSFSISSMAFLADIRVFSFSVINCCSIDWISAYNGRKKENDT